MVELLVVVALFAAVVGGPALVAIAPWDVTFGAGVALVIIGMGVGVPAGAYYHFRLWRALKPGRLWWLRPTALHSILTPADRPGVIRWFRVGAVMWGVAILGCALLTIGALRGS